MRKGLLLLMILASACSTTESPADGGCVPDPGAGCISNCATGNEFKVGEYCTKNGGQCDDNKLGKEALFCTQDQREDAIGFCTWPCTKNSDCGTGAVCTGDSPESTVKGCLPSVCDPSNPGTP